MTDDREQVEQFKNRFYTSITHEFKSPLTVIIGLADKLRQNGTPDQMEKLDLIYTNGHALLNSIERILNIQRFQQGEIKPEIRLYDVIEFIGQTIKSSILKRFNPSVEIQFITELESVHMAFDQTILSEIISDLLSNAIKFSPDNSLVKVVAALDESEYDNPYLKIDIIDQGVGIPSDLQEDIFNEFYSYSPNSPDLEGLGIGLYWTRSLAGLLDGEITFKSREGHGSTFTCRLPVRTVVKDEHLIGEGINNISDELRSDDEGDKKLILLVEDSYDILQYMDYCLSDKFQIITGTNGDEGTTLAIENVPDLIISDILMPVKNGYELTEEVKSNVLTNHIPIILLTALSDVENRVKGYDLGADAYIAKPFKEAELLSIVDNLIKQREVIKEKFTISDPSETYAERFSKSRDQEFINNVMDIINEKLDDDMFNVNELAKRAFISPRQLSRKLKALTDLSPNQLIRKIRLQKAYKLIKEENCQINEVSYQVGFTSHSHFSSSFKKEFGVSPSQI